MDRNRDTMRRNTRQRQVVLEELRKVSSHPTAAELYELTRERLPRISMGTVYRNLELLARMGTISKLDMGAGEARFDGETARHDHIRCAECGRVDDIKGSHTQTTPPEIAGPAGYEILGYRLEFIGVCPQCRNRVPSPEGVGRRCDVD